MSMMWRTERTRPPKAGSRPAWRWSGLLVLAAIANLTAKTPYVTSPLAPPPPPQEFRGVWVASVSNIDWPSKPGLPVSQQKAELLAHLERATKARLNAVVLQIRPACDALYASTLEPWSEYLTGQSGKAPKPLWDPLAFAVAEAHSRGLELHAWFNPFRARHPSAKSPPAAGHVSRTSPELVRTYGKHLWLDPAEKGAREHTLKVVLDVVKRYDLDGVHMDDYFYPYHEKDAAGKEMDFPDDAPWKQYQARKGKLSRADWRRENINTFIEEAYRAVKTQKPWVKFGISPFGIWRPGYPAQIKGYDPYEKLYADSRKWLQQGWLDYLAPQLYWSIEAKEQSFPVLLKWWQEQNTRHRHIWPGISTGRVGGAWKAEEIAAQIRLTRVKNAAPGVIHWSAKAFTENRGGILDQLPRQAYTNEAIVPACSWLGKEVAARAKISSSRSGSTGPVLITWDNSGWSKPARWVLQTRQGTSWTCNVYSGEQKSLNWPGTQPLPNAIAIQAMDRFGNLSAPAVLEYKGP